MVELGHSDGMTQWGMLRGHVGPGASFYINNDWATQAGFEQAPAGTGFFTATSGLPDAVAKWISDSICLRSKAWTRA